MYAQNDIGQQYERNSFTKCCIALLIKSLTLFHYSNLENVYAQPIVATELFSIILDHKRLRGAFSAM